MKHCLDCGDLTYHARCPTCQRAQDKIKNSKAGYRRSYEWQQLSKAVRRANPQCVECGSTHDLTADHVVPRSLAGGVRTLCRSCNASKGAR